LNFVKDFQKQGFEVRFNVYGFSIQKIVTFPFTTKGKKLHWNGSALAARTSLY
jgi:hypothetical protein